MGRQGLVTAIRYSKVLAAVMLCASLTVPMLADQAAEQQRSDESKRQAEIQKRRETSVRRDPRSTGQSSVGYVTSPWEMPRTYTSSGCRDTDSSQRLSVGYVTSPWALPRTYTSLKDTEKSCRYSNRPVCRTGYYYYPCCSTSRTYRFGYWVWKDYGPSFCRRSVYYYYGVLPYVEIVRLYLGPYTLVEYCSAPVTRTDSYYLARHDELGLDSALSEIRTAWMAGRIDLIRRHVSSNVRIAVLLDGRYDYSLDPEDYIQMTADAMDELRTVSFTWQDVRQRTDGAFTAFGKHVYSDSSGSTRTVYVSYTLRRIGSEWVIMEVGSSRSPLIASATLDASS